MAVITSAGSGDWDAGATWVGGVAPGTGDDAIIANTHTVTLTADQVTGSCEIQSGGTLAGGGYTLTCDNETTQAFDTDGIISGVLDLEITTGTGTSIDLNGFSGNVRNLVLNTSYNVAFSTNFTIDGNLTLSSSGIFYPSTNTKTVNIVGNLIINDGQFGVSTWTGDLTIGGKLENYGTMLGDSTQTIVGPSDIYGDGIGTFPDSLQEILDVGKGWMKSMQEWNFLWDTNVMQKYDWTDPDKDLHQPNRGDW